MRKMPLQKLQTGCLMKSQRSEKPASGVSMATFQTLARNPGMTCSSKYAIVTQRRAQNTTGKNSADIMLVIDAMRSLCTGDRLDGFCRSFFRQRFYEARFPHPGAGQGRVRVRRTETPESFRQACHRFLHRKIGDRALTQATRTRSRTASLCKSQLPQPRLSRRRSRRGSKTRMAGRLSPRWAVNLSNSLRF